MTENERETLLLSTAQRWITVNAELKEATGNRAGELAILGMQLQHDMQLLCDRDECDEGECPGYLTVLPPQREKLAL